MIVLQFNIEVPFVLIGSFLQVLALYNKLQKIIFI